MLWDKSISWNKSSGPHCVSQSCWILIKAANGERINDERWYVRQCVRARSLDGHKKIHWNFSDFLQIKFKRNQNQMKTIPMKNASCFLWCGFDVVIAGLGMLIRRKRHRPFDMCQHIASILFALPLLLVARISYPNWICWRSILIALLWLINRSTCMHWVNIKVTNDHLYRRFKVW